VFSFIGESSVLPVKVEKGKVWLDDTPLDLRAAGVPNGPAQLFLRPHDVEVVHAGTGAIEGAVAVFRRHAGTRRVDVEVGKDKDRIEIELPADFALDLSGPLAFRPRHYRLFSAA
jgi:sulfate transport system ATP-binding protein